LLFNQKGGDKMSGAWTWANLNQEQLGMLEEAEQTLGTDILIAYQDTSRVNTGAAWLSRSGLQVASLNDSQLECLQGLEKQVQAVVIAYQQAGKS
jgi:hypothetical protein